MEDLDAMYDSTTVEEDFVNLMKKGWDADSFKVFAKNILGEEWKVPQSEWSLFHSIIEEIFCSE